MSRADRPRHTDAILHQVRCFVCQSAMHCTQGSVSVLGSITVWLRDIAFLIRDVHYYLTLISTRRNGETSFFTSVRKMLFLILASIYLIPPFLNPCYTFIQNCGNIGSIVVSIDLYVARFIFFNSSNC